MPVYNIANIILCTNFQLTIYTIIYVLYMYIVYNMKGIYAIAYILLDYTRCY